MKTPGQIAYDAYAHSRSGKTHDDHAMPAWDELPEGIRDAWEASAQAIADQTLASADQESVSDAERVLNAFAARFAPDSGEAALLREVAGAFGVSSLQGEQQGEVEPPVVDVTLGVIEVYGEDHEVQETYGTLLIPLWHGGRLVPLMFDTPLELITFAEKQQLRLNFDTEAAQLCRNVMGDIEDLLPPVRTGLSS